MSAWGNCTEVVVAIFAALKAGAVFACINSTTKLAKLSYILNDCRATALVSHVRRRSLIAQLLDDVPSLGLVALAGAEEDMDWDSPTEGEARMVSPSLGSGRSSRPSRCAAGALILIWLPSSIPRAAQATPKG